MDAINNIRLPRGVAAILGVSSRRARELARHDPDFPAVIVLGPRTKLVAETDLLRYLESKKMPACCVMPGVKA